MPWKSLAALLTCLLLPFSVGCSTGTGLVRGQSPVPGDVSTAVNTTVSTTAGSEIQTAAQTAEPEATPTETIQQTQYQTDPAYEGQTCPPEGYYEDCPPPDSHPAIFHTAVARMFGHLHGPPAYSQYGNRRMGFGTGMVQQRFQGGFAGQGGAGQGGDAEREDGYEPVGDWYPTHYHTYWYHPPKNLRYPSQQVPAGTVRYPYYTTKGPSDFFMK